MFRRLSIILVMLSPFPAMAQEAGVYACTNMMGGNPFALILGDGTYIIQSKPNSYRPIEGEGDLIVDPMRTYLMVGSGPLLDDWKVDTIHGMSGNNLVLTGEDGLMNCEPKSKS